jgi:hypothetical protein
MKCGVMYVKLVPNTDDLKWIRYCYLIKSLPIAMQRSIEETVSYINNKYKDYLITPMNLGVHPGCIVMPEFTDIVAKDVFDKYNEMMKKYTDTPSVRCMCLIGEVTNPYSSDNINTTYGPALVKLGRTLDLTDDAGLFIL